MSQGERETKMGLVKLIDQSDKVGKNTNIVLCLYF